MASFSSTTTTWQIWKTVKLDHTNYVVWKHQITIVLNTYSMMGFIILECCSQYLQGSARILTSEVNPNYKNGRSMTKPYLASSTLLWDHQFYPWLWVRNLIKEFGKFLISDIHPSPYHMCLIWKKKCTIWERKMTWSMYIRKRSKKREVAVSVFLDDEELLHVALKGLPREFGPFCSTIWTRNWPLNFEEFHTLLFNKRNFIHSKMLKNTH